MDLRNFYKTRAGKTATGLATALTLTLGGLGVSDALAKGNKAQNPFDQSTHIEFECTS
jgi:hypothetical protein